MTYSLNCQGLKFHNHNNRGKHKHKKENEFNNICVEEYKVQFLINETYEVTHRHKELR